MDDEPELVAIKRQLDDHGMSLIVRQVRERAWLAFAWDRRLPVDDLGGPPRIATGSTCLAAAANLLLSLGL